MRVIVSGAVLTEFAHEPWKLHRLMAYVCEGRHVLLVDPPAALNQWLATLDDRTRTNYEQAMGFAARTSATLSSDVATVRVETTAQPVWQDSMAVLALDDSLAVLNEPLGVLVENAANDWSFLLGIMRRSERERLQRAVTQRWVEPVHGGGQTLQRQLEARLASPTSALRTFVLFDSDRLHPREFASNWTPDRPGHRRAACPAFEWERIVSQSLPCRYWMLRRRFIESYMPKEELPIGAAQATPSDAFERFAEMSRDQRWYFNMKHGFFGDNRRHDSDRRCDLYSTAIMTNPALQGGFGEELANHYAEAIDRQFNWDAEAREEATAMVPRLMRLI